ncbi:fatty acyl-CoA reductase 1-like [Vespa mandarinia]|uniref:fatty acyl-CoA reductase 1-like n=1 Tax=Vespa mandarinia TaxID=7446 RepID=UPI00161AC24D|nr:fatty acyl-CoA reductase 1-like [Vespa mandarinia]
MEKQQEYEIKNISKFFAGRSIFITGGTGFLGKILIEKCLRSCPDIKEIFILMRPKKNITIDDRLKKLFTLPIFNKLKEMNPSAFEKVIVVKGDVSEKDLGLDSIDKQILIDNVSIIFHIAANVKFNDSLRNAIFTNLRSARDICLLGEKMKKLVALVHISSTYAHCDKSCVEETTYPAEIDWRQTIEITENVDDHILTILTSKYIGTLPNTYIFSKKLAENVISDFSTRLPCVIVRPSIVISTMDEPIPGWVDNFNGPGGLMVGGGKGILKILYADPDKELDYIPADIVIKSFIISAYIRGQMSVTQNPKVEVYNVSSYKIKKISINEMVRMSLKINTINPLENPIWYPHLSITVCYMYYYICVIIFQVFPALILDQILKFSGRKPMLLKLQRKIYVANISLSYFMMNYWQFYNDNLMSALSRLSAEDKRDFNFNYSQFNLYEFLQTSLKGGKQYLLHEDEEKIDENLRKLNRLWWIDKITKTCSFIFFLWILLKMVL